MVLLVYVRKVTNEREEERGKEGRREGGEVGRREGKVILHTLEFSILCCPYQCIRVPSTSILSQVPDYVINILICVFLYEEGGERGGREEEERKKGEQGGEED